MGMPHRLYTRASGLDRAAFCKLIAAKADGAASALAQYAHDAPIRIVIDDSHPGLLVCWEATRGQQTLILSSERAEFTGTHLARSLPIVAAYHRAGTPVEGCVYVSMEDHHLRYDGISFCDKGDAFLVPDPIFMLHNAYAETRARLDNAAVPWNERKPIAGWRGSTTGRPTTPGDWRTLPRVRLCELSQVHRTLIDARISVAVQWPDMDVSHLQGDYVPPYDWAQWRYQIDMTGTAMPGLASCSDC